MYVIKDSLLIHFFKTDAVHLAKTKKTQLLLIALSYQMLGLFLLQRFADKAFDISR